MNRLTGILASAFVFALAAFAVAVAAQNPAAPPAGARALPPAVLAEFAQLCRARAPGFAVTVAGQRRACPTPTGRFFNSCEECNAACPGPCFLTSAMTCQCMLEHLPSD